MLTGAAACVVDSWRFSVRIQTLPNLGSRMDGLQKMGMVEVVSHASDRPRRTKDRAEMEMNM